MSGSLDDHVPFTWTYIMPLPGDHSTGHTIETAEGCSCGKLYYPCDIRTEIEKDDA